MGTSDQENHNRLIAYEKKYKSLQDEYDKTRAAVLELKG